LGGDDFIDANATDADSQPSADMAVVSAAMITAGVTSGRAINLDPAIR
jgi:hypothetical protein